MTYISCPKKPGTENFNFYYALHKASLVNGTYMYSLEGPIFLKRGLNIFLTLKINFSENQGHCTLRSLQNAYLGGGDSIFYLEGISFLREIKRLNS